LAYLLALSWLQRLFLLVQAGCDAAHITLNKNAVVGDMSAMNPGGVRIGTPAMTSRGLRETDFETVADLLHEV
jgi:glycine hydroxymethyltransferase